jgi:peptide/nickel transport system substrate-binding protein
MLFFGGTLASASRARRRSLAAVAAAIAAIAGIAGASSVGATAGTAKPVLTIGSPDGCNSLLATGTGAGGDTEFASQLDYETLLIGHALGNNNFKFTPGLATAWKIYPGNKKFQLTLRPNARFSDGTAVTAQAVAAYFNYREKNLSGFNLLGPIASIQTPSKNVIVVTLKTPNPVIQLTLTQSDYGAVTSTAAIQQAEADPQHSPLVTQSFGAGPYTVARSQTVLGDHCTYVPNKYYYDQSRIRWSKVVIRKITDPNALLAALKSGQIQVAWGFPQTAASAKAAGFKVVDGKGWGFGGGMTGILFLDHGGAISKPIANVKVRQAMNYAIDRKAIVKAIYQGFAAPTSSPSNGWDGVGPKDPTYYNYNPTKAKQLLAQAGYPEGFSFDLAGAVCNVPTGPYNLVCPTIVKYLAAVGIKANLDLDPSFPGFVKKTAPAAFWTVGPLYMVAWYQFMMMPNGALADQHGWHDPVIDHLYYNKFIRLPSVPAEKVAEQITDRATQMAYFVPVLSEDFLVFASPKIAGVNAARLFLNTSDWAPAK